MEAKDNPCIRCGACCAYFRVEFYWREEVPLELTHDLSPFLKCMQGTNKKRSSRCVALHGRVGEEVSCSIYENRPTPCRAFSATSPGGEGRNKRCDEARIANGLKPLK